MSCLHGMEHNLVKLRKNVIKYILSHKKDTCPRLELQEFIIDPTRLEYPVDSLSSLTLYDIEHIAARVVRKKPVVVSCTDEGRIRIKITDLLPFEHINPDTLSVFAGRSPETLTDARSEEEHSRNHLDISDLEDVEESVKEIVDWMGLGLRLGLLYSTLKKIESDLNRVDKCKREMLAAWLQGEDNSKDRTWSTLVDALHGMDNHLLADKIRQHLK